MKIEVGKTYKTKGGDVVKIIAMDPYDNTYPYEGSNGFWYTSTGTYYYYNGWLSDPDLDPELVDDGSSESIPNIGSSLMRFDPVDGSEKPYPSEANQYREYHGQVAWLFNPYTGVKRDARDIGSDVFGLAITNRV